jgi:hypothetical protein
MTIGGRGEAKGKVGDDIDSKFSGIYIKNGLQIQEFILTF